MNLILKWKGYKAIRKILRRGNNEIINGKIMIQFYKWQKSKAPENASKEELGKIDLKIKQTEGIVKNNEVMNTTFKAFISGK